MSVYDDVWGYDHHCIWAAHYEFFFHSNNRYNIVIAAEDLQRQNYPEYFDWYGSYFWSWANWKGDNYHVCEGIMNAVNPTGCHSTTADDIHLSVWSGFPANSFGFYYGSRHHIHIWNFM